MHVQQSVAMMAQQVTPYTAMETPVQGNITPRGWHAPAFACRRNRRHVERCACAAFYK